MNSPTYETQPLTTLPSTTQGTKKSRSVAHYNKFDIDFKKGKICLKLPVLAWWVVPALLWEQSPHI